MNSAACPRLTGQIVAVHPLHNAAQISQSLQQMSPSTGPQVPSTCSGRAAQDNILEAIRIRLFDNASLTQPSRNSLVSISTGQARLHLIDGRRSGKCLRPSSKRRAPASQGSQLVVCASSHQSQPQLPRGPGGSVIDKGSWPYHWSPLEIPAGLTSKLPGNVTMPGLCKRASVPRQLAINFSRVPAV